MMTMRAAATTPEAYLGQLPADRRAAIAAQKNNSLYLLNVIGELIASMSVEKWIAIVEASRRKRTKCVNA